MAAVASGAKPRQLCLGARDAEANSLAEATSSPSLHIIDFRVGISQFCHYSKDMLTISQRPALRDIMISNPQSFSSSSSRKFSLNWLTARQYHETDPRSGLIKLTEEFKTFVSNQENWSYDEGLLDLVPGFAKAE